MRAHVPGSSRCLPFLTACTAAIFAAPELSTPQVQHDVPVLYRGPENTDLPLEAPAAAASRAGAPSSTTEAPRTSDDAETIETDRPDFTDSPRTVPAGLVQLETGYTLERRRSEEFTSVTHSFGEPLLRIGLSRSLELRLAAAPVLERVTEGTKVTETWANEFLLLGTKVALGSQRGLRPSRALLVESVLPTAGEADPIGDGTFRLALLYAWDLSPRWSIGGSSHVEYSPGKNFPEQTVLIQSITSGWDLGSGLGAYLEWFAFQPLGPAGGGGEHYLNGGFTYLARERVQLDVRVGRGLTTSAADFFFGVGLSIRSKPIISLFP